VIAGKLDSGGGSTATPAGGKAKPGPPEKPSKSASTKAAAGSGGEPGHLQLLTVQQAGGSRSRSISPRTPSSTADSAGSCRGPSNTASSSGGHDAVDTALAGR